MTFETWCTEANTGNPIPDLFVQANNEITGESFTRSTDGRGYADVAVLGQAKEGDRITFVVIDPKLRYQGVTLGDDLVIGKENQILRFELPFA